LRGFELLYIYKYVELGFSACYFISSSSSLFSYVLCILCKYKSCGEGNPKFQVETKTNTLSHVTVSDRKVEAYYIVFPIFVIINEF
jgi:hypothetical protein